MPQVSVIIPAFNRQKLIGETIRSVQAQSIDDWELLVVDDGSTDGTQDVVLAYAATDNRIRFAVRSHQAKGPSACRNIGINNAKSEYCLFLDSDDILAPDCLKNRLEVASKTPEIEMHIFQMQFFYKVPGDTERLFMFADESDALGSSLLVGSPWGITCPLWKTSALLKLEGFNEELQSWEDWDLHIRAFLNGYKYKIYPIIDSYCRQGLISLTSQHNSVPHLKQRIEAYIKLGKLFKAKSISSNYKSKLAGKCLSLCGELNKAGEQSIAKAAWEKFVNAGLVSVKEYYVGLLYMGLKKNIAKDSNAILAKIIRKGIAYTTSHDFVWGY